MPGITTASWQSWHCQTKGCPFSMSKNFSKRKIRRRGLRLVEPTPRRAYASERIRHTWPQNVHWQPMRFKGLYISLLIIAAKRGYFLRKSLDFGKRHWLSRWAFLIRVLIWYFHRFFNPAWCIRKENQWIFGALSSASFKPIIPQFQHSIIPIVSEAS